MRMQVGLCKESKEESGNIAKGLRVTAAKVENGSNVRRARLGTVVGPHGQSQARSSMSTDRSRKLEQDLGSFTMITGACASSFFPCVLLFYGKKKWTLGRMEERVR